MKQSQNAITFLSAQYRAVYGRAYVKGLASAMVLTSALFGSYAAHAADPTTNDFILRSDGDWNNPTNYKQSEDAPRADYTRVESGYFGNISLDKSGASMGITDIKLKGELNIGSGTTAQLTGYENVGRTIYGWDNADGRT